MNELGWCGHWVVFDARDFARSRGVCDCERCCEEYERAAIEYAREWLSHKTVSVDPTHGKTCECADCRADLLRLKGMLDWRRIAGTCPCEECDDKWHTIDYQHVVVEDLSWDTYNTRLCRCESCMKQYAEQFEAAVERIMPEAMVVFGSYDRDARLSCDCERCKHVWQAAHDACQWEDVSRACECEECTEEREESHR